MAQAGYVLFSYASSPEETNQKPFEILPYWNLQLYPTVVPVTLQMENRISTTLTKSIVVQMGLETLEVCMLYFKTFFFF